MKYIVFDLEFTVMRSQQHLAEIIEIGAIELRQDDAGRLVMTDLFHSHVRPSRAPILSKLTMSFTGINQEQVNAAPSFRDVVKLYQKWLGDEDYYLCAWGPDDKNQFIRECHAQGSDLEWLRNYNDIQIQFTRLYGADIGQRIGLKKSLTLADIPFFGKQHNALDDAFNTAKLFSKIFPQLKLERNNAAFDPLYTTTTVYSSGEEVYKPFSQLASLLQMAL